MSASVFSTLSGVLTGKHPELGLLVREDGKVLLPASAHHKARWTYGCKSKGTGYMVVESRGKQYGIHRLVAQTFLDNPFNLPTVDHINRVRDDNRLENIRYASHKLQQDNQQRVDDSLARYGFRSCEDRKNYDRAHYANNSEYAESRRARYRELYATNPEFAESRRAKCREWWEKQKALGKKQRKCPDGKRRLLTDEEFNELYAIHR